MPQQSYVETIETLCTPSFLNTLEVQYKKLVSDQITILNGRQSNDSNLVESEVELREISKNDSNWVTVAAALYHLLGKQKNDSKRITVAHRLHRRNIFNHLDTADDIGYYAGDIPISLESQLCSDIKKVGESLLTAKSEMVMGGVGYEILANQGKMKSATELTRIRLNFQPFSLLQDSKSILVEEIDTSLISPAAHKRPYDLDCIVRKIDRQKTEFIVRYNQNQYEKSIIQSFVNDWVNLISQSV